MNFYFVKNNIDRYTLVDENRVFIINAVNLNDNARYTCIGTNIAGELSKHMDLQIFGMVDLLQGVPEVRRKAFPNEGSTQSD